MEKVFFSPGDVVTMKQDIPNKPTMVVQNVDKANAEIGGGNALKVVFLGITCIWFSEDKKLQKHRFNTKDLIHV